MPPDPPHNMEKAKLVKFYFERQLTQAASAFLAVLPELLWQYLKLLTAYEYFLCTQYCRRTSDRKESCGVALHHMTPIWVTYLHFPEGILQLKYCLYHYIY